MRECWWTQHGWLLSASKRGFFSRPDCDLGSLVHDECLLLHLFQKFFFLGRWVILRWVDDLDHLIIIERSIHSNSSWFNSMSIIRHSSRRDISLPCGDQSVPLWGFLLVHLLWIFQRCDCLIYCVDHIRYINFRSFSFCRLNVIWCDWTIKILKLDWMSCLEKRWA